jgi:orotidine-5'-phosphate decarboxylase
VAELVVAFDLPSGPEALALADRLPGLRWAKLGPVLYVREGPAMVREFTARGVRVSRSQMARHPEHGGGRRDCRPRAGVSLATVHCLGGHAMLEAASRRRGSASGRRDGTNLARRIGLGAGAGAWRTDLGFEAERLARTAVAAGLRGVVASGHALALLRAALGPDPWMVVPGIRLPGDSAGDQVRTMSPADAVRRGATHLVVGRSITAAADPAAAYHQIVGAL